MDLYLWGYIYSEKFNFGKSKGRKYFPGGYAFELTVTDAEGSVSKDTVFIRVSVTPEEYNLDITFTGIFNFKDNFHYVDFYYDEYYDFTEISGKGNFSPFGDFEVYVAEYADTAALSNGVYGNGGIVHIYLSGPGQPPYETGIYMYGACSVNFKKLIGQAGGPFNGNLKIESGSAGVCDNNNIFINLPPLSVTGNLDIATKKVILRIQGKVFF